MESSDLTGRVIGCAMKVHSALGPGLLERPYQVCLAHELRKAGIGVEVEVPIPIRYDSVTVELGYRVDLLVEGELVVEVKAVTQLLPVHRSQLLTQLKFSGKHLGLMINFHEFHLRNGIIRMVNNLK